MRMGANGARNALGALLITALSATDAVAVDPKRALTQARLTTWNSDTGLPQSTIGPMLQTADGYFWLGTEEGLVRFDGVRFVIRDRATDPQLRSSFISSLHQSADGTIWIGTYGGGLARLRGGPIEAFHPDILGTDRLREMETAADGSLYVATAGGGLLKINGERIARITTREGLPNDRIWALEKDGEGGIFIATHGAGVVQWKDSRVVRRITTREGLTNDFARTLLRDEDGTLWIGTDGGGVTAWRGGSVVRRLTMREGLPSDLVRAMLRDRNGSLWIATDAGVTRISGETLESLSFAEGLPSPIVRSLAEDREGNVWLGTTAGLVRLRDTRFLSYTRQEGLPVEGIRPLLEGSDGAIWIGTEGGGLCSLESGKVRCITPRDGLPHNTVYALAHSQDGSLWAGTDGGGVARVRDGRIVQIVDAAKSGLQNNRVRGVFETPDRALWISTTAGVTIVGDDASTDVPALRDRQVRPLLALPDGSVAIGTDGAGLWRVSADGKSATQIASAGKGLESDRIFSLVLDSKRQAIWIGTSGGGLARLELESGAIRSLTRRNGMHDDVVFQIVDAGADLWLTSNRGLHRVPTEKVLAAMNGAGADLSGIVYGMSDGMPSGECNAGFPSAIRTRDGSLWIATARGIAVIDPSANPRNDVPPSVHIEETNIDGVSAAARPLRVAAGSRRVELRYTAVSFRAPERVTFRYRLDGYDSDWVDAGPARVAHYTRLAPGTYTFRVTARNEDGVPSRTEARLDVTVDPRWFESWWARVLAIALLAAVVWGIFRLRLAALRARKNEEIAVAYRDVQRMAGELENSNLQLALANERLQALSYLDGLTGVANRRRFDEAMVEACAAARRDGSPLSLILLDLDHFKALNDSHGHQHGDEALRIVAQLLAEQAAARGGVVARFGGEEFGWILPGAAIEEAVALAETIRGAVRAAAIRHDRAEPLVVTASLGVASAVGTTSLSSESLIAAADAALYRAKSRGRDRVESETVR